MAGHSKWANIQHRKGRQDEKRGRIWTRLIREIVVAARHALVRVVVAEALYRASTILAGHPYHRE